MNRTTLSSLVISTALLASGVAIHLFAVEPAADAAPPPPAVAAGPAQLAALAAAPAPAPPASLDPLDARERELDRRERALDERAALADGVFRDLELQRAWVEQRVAAVTSESVRRMPQLSGFLASDPTAPLPVVPARVELEGGTTQFVAVADESSATSVRTAFSERPPAEPSPISTEPPSSPSPPPGEVSGPPVVWGNGAFAPTHRANDLAIDGRGWFVVQGASQRLYTRWGRFGFDVSGRIVDSVGQPVLGYGIDPETGLANGVLGEMQLPTTLSPPRSTTTIELSVNLDANARIVASGFDPARPGQTTHWHIPIDVYDSLGQQHSLNLFFTKIATNVWQWSATLAPLETTLPAASLRDLWVVQGSGTITFRNDGTMMTLTGTTFALEFAGGAEPSQAVSVAFTDAGSASTQYSNDTAANSFSQDGYAPGTLQNTFWDAAGYLKGSFSNGETLSMARLALASFWNPDGLEAVNGTDMAATPTSGDPHIAAPLTDGLGRIRGAVLEQPDIGPWQCIPTSNDIHAGGGS